MGYGSVSNFPKKIKIKKQDWVLPVKHPAMEGKKERKSTPSSKKKNQAPREKR